MKATVMKCKCGRVTNPVQIEIVKDTWVKKGVIHYEFDCPECRKTNVIKVPVPIKKA